MSRSVLALLLLAGLVHADRVKWTTGKITGSPEAPPPYAAPRVYQNAKFYHPLLVQSMPGLPYMAVAEQDGKLWAVDSSKPNDKPSQIVDLKANQGKLAKNPNAKEFEFLYGFTCHPKFETNRTVFLCYTFKGKPGKTPPFDHEKNLPDGTRVSRFQMTVKPGEAPTIDPSTEEVLLTYPQGGHNGGDIHFGPDGYLYISTGDAADPNPPDPFKTGTDCSDLLSSILRIDVDKTADGMKYAIPADNPFINTKHSGKTVRPEIWSYGYRNAWRFSFDRVTGDLWVGDVGWEQWEMVHLAKKGSNHGWSLVEGRQPTNSQLDPGPTPTITPPVIELDHTQAGSVNGGYIYRGKKFPELVGKYIFSDYMTKRMWAATLVKGRMTELKDIIDPTVRVVAFGEDHDGELYFVDYDTGLIHTLAKNDQPTYDPKSFPRTLSGTGLFAKLKEHTLAPGVRTFEVNVPLWSDGATAQRFLAVPGDGVILDIEGRKQLGGTIDWLPYQYHFPKDSVLGRTVTLTLSGGKTKRIETQLLHYDGRYWQAYTYQWRDDETDAELVEADGTEKNFLVDDARVIGGKRDLQWSFASRAQCLTCHTPWAETTLAFNTKNINLEVNGKNQLLDLCDSGLLKRVKNNGKDNPAYDAKSIKRLPKHTNPTDMKANLEDRARSYLHVNCSHCHRNGGGGGLTFELTANSDLKMVLDVKPSRGDFGLTNAKLVAKGEPFSSTLLYRMAKFGRDRMPHIGAETPDHDGLKLLTQWIFSLGDSKSIYKPISTKPMAEQLLSPSFGLSQACMPAPEQLKRVIKAATNLEPGASRELFEGYLPPGGERKLGPNPRPKAITSLKGDAVKGKALFLTANLKCIDCHKLGDTGKTIGPDLSKIGAERSADELLESMLLPSRRVEPKYQSYILKSIDGTAVTGVLVSRDGKNTSIRDATDKLHTYANADIEEFKPARESLMPSGLLNDLTPQQAADMLEFLKTSGK